jgi:DNA-binding NtrC family response regulator
MNEYKTMIGANAGMRDSGILPVFIVKVIGGPQDGELFPLDWTQTSRALLGTSAGCTVQIRDSRVSRRHLSLGPQGVYLRLTDLSSTNGTKIGGVRTLEALLQGGETISVGETTLRLMKMGDAKNPMQYTGTSFGRVLGKSDEMQRAFVLGARLAQTHLPLLVEGDTGTGKELFAEAIHEVSACATGPFVVLSCNASSASLLDGSAFEQASGGTLVLNEPSDLSPEAQARVLQLLAQSAKTIRTVALSKRDLDREVESGRLRDDLLFRLNGGRIELPPLRHRHGDIALLAAHFWTLGGGTGQPPETLLAQLHDYAWPGNVREFRHAIDRAVALGEAFELRGGFSIAHPSGAPMGSSLDLQARLLDMDLSLAQARAQLVNDFELRYVEAALKRHGGNVTRAAAASGLTRRYFHMLRAKQRDAP